MTIINLPRLNTLNETAAQLRCSKRTVQRLPVVVSGETQVPVAIGESGGPYRTRTYDQFLKREMVDGGFQGLGASNDD
jgi:hypothetical protein